MSNLSRIHKNKNPKRLHFIPEWTERRGETQASIVKAIGVDKSLVSRWFKKGNVPSEKWIEPLSAFLQLEEPNFLFRHPDDDWLTRFFANRNDEERQRVIQMLEAAFPKTGTNE